MGGNSGGSDSARGPNTNVLNNADHTRTPEPLRRHPFNAREKITRKNMKMTIIRIYGQA